MEKSEQNCKKYSEKYNSKHHKSGHNVSSGDIAGLVLGLSALLLLPLLMMRCLAPKRNEQAENAVVNKKQAKTKLNQQNYQLHQDLVEDSF